MLTWDQITRLAKGGVAIEGHTHSHRDLRTSGMSDAGHDILPTRSGTPTAASQSGSKNATRPPSPIGSVSFQCTPAEAGCHGSTRITCAERLLDCRLRRRRCTHI